MDITWCHEMFCCTGKIMWNWNDAENGNKEHLDITITKSTCASCCFFLGKKKRSLTNVRLAASSFLNVRLHCFSFIYDGK